MSRKLTLNLDTLHRNYALIYKNGVIIVLSKTWLSNSVNDAELGFCEQYTIFRCGQCKVQGIGIRGGGVLTTVKNKFNCHHINIQNNYVEQVFVKIIFKSYLLIICSVYILPNSDINNYNFHTNSVDKLLCDNSNSKCLLLDD